MANIGTTYLGLDIKSPVIASSSGLTRTVDSIKTLEENGAGAVILKSLFEEQINHEAGNMLNQSKAYPEAEDYVRNYAKHNSVSEYLTLIKESKKACDIPVVASINCIDAKDWTDFATRIEEAGADALELNINIIPDNGNIESIDLETRYYDIAEAILSKVSIPVSVKIGSHFTNILRVVKQLQFRGIKGVTIFNRFYHPDINIDTMEMVSASVFSNDKDIQHSLRWVGMISGKMHKAEISASTGIHNGAGVIKQLLAGAQTTQVCSALYKKGLSYMSHINKEVTEWMDANGYDKISDFRGKLSYKNIKNPQFYERSQFMKYFSSME
ncbi:MAG: dihydroorotate dehydrogenase-like protein [Bacteroidota bacterium]|nr:dihydroorotate dehydrogenase-like protein [Bacteroidota bacterium]